MAIDGNKNTQTHKAPWLIDAMVVPSFSIQSTSLVFLETMMPTCYKFLDGALVFLHDSLYILAFHWIILYIIKYKKIQVNKQLKHTHVISIKNKKQDNQLPRNSPHALIPSLPTLQG